MSEQHEDHGLVIVNGNVITMDAADSHAEAVLMSGGKVVAVGSNRDLEKMAGPDAQRLDVDGATVLPGLLDTHPHLVGFGIMEELLIKIWDCRNHDEIVATIAEHVAGTPEGDWIQTTPVGEPHFFHRRSYRDLEEGMLPGRKVLDRASTRHPIAIQAWAPVRPNCLALNSLGLEKLGITRDSPDRVGNVWIDKDADGEPTGLLTGSVINYYANEPFSKEIWGVIPFAQIEGFVPGLQSAIELYHAQGVTSVYENHIMTGAAIGLLRQLREQGGLEIRMLLSQEAEEYGFAWSEPREMDEFTRQLEEAAKAIELDDPIFRFNGLTMAWDGYCCGGTQMMRNPYLDVYGRLTHGQRQITLEKAEIVARFCAEKRIRLNVLAMGTAAHEEVLSLMERLASEYDIESLNWVLVHATTIEAEQVKRYKRLNFSVTTSMAFSWGEGAMMQRSMGQKVLDDLLPLRRFFDNDMPVGGATDWGPPTVWDHIENSLTHEFGETGYRNLGPNQKISRVEALAMFTRDAAKVMRWDEIGSIAEGKYADIVIVDQNPITCEIEALKNTRVLRTILGGKTVFDSGDLP